jgi:mannose-6-phosphate isomerase-like protein (cupin superfamily)
MKGLYLITIILISAGAGYLSHPGSSKENKVENPYSIVYCMTTFSKEKIEATKAGWAFWYTRKELTGGVNLKISNINVGNTNHAPHKHADDEILLILEGEAEFTLADEKAIAGPNTSLYCPPNVMHGINRVGDKPLKYLVIKLD